MQEILNDLQNKVYKELILFRHRLANISTFDIIYDNLVLGGAKY